MTTYEEFMKQFKNCKHISFKRLTTYLKQMADFCEKSEAYGLDEKTLIEAKAQARFSRMLVRLIEGGNFDEE